MYYRLFVVACAALGLISCASRPLPPTGPAPIIPIAPPLKAQWENLGVSPSGNILNEIDKLSVQYHGSIAIFRDRKTIFDIKKENYGATPQHKVSINTWRIDCADRTFQLIDMELFDQNNQQIAKFSYHNDQVKPMPVVRNSASYQQMVYVCADLKKQ